MKLPSLRQAALDARRTFLRFPFVILDAVLGTAAVLLLVDHEGPPRPTFLFKVLYAGILGIPLLIALALAAEKKRWSARLALGAQFIGVLLLVAYGLSVPSDVMQAPAVHVLRLLILAIALHLFVAFAPFVGKGGVHGFWHYNKALFLRSLTSILYSLVLYGGLAIALAALDNLFGIHVPGKRYLELWTFITGLFMTWFFLAGVPEDLDGLDALTDYPKGLKLFSQYILLPLVMIYAIILYAYLAKIVISWDWPQGWVSKLILGFSATGLFSILLLHPVSGQTENVWIKTASRWFYVAMVPLIVMLFLAVWRRVSEYGFTEGRYLAIALGVWLAFLIPYFIFSAGKSIKAIPASLCAVSFVVSFGPWGAFSVSEQSQITRFKALLAKSRILVDSGKIQKVHGPVPFEDVKEIGSILTYLHDIHGYDGIQNLFDESLRVDSKEGGYAFVAPEVIANKLGIEYVHVWQSAAGGMILLSAERGRAIDVSGYDRMLHGQHVAAGTTSGGIPGQEVSYRVSDNLDTLTFTLVREGRLVDSVPVDVREVANGLLKDYGNANTDRIPIEKMAASNAGKILKVKVCLWQIRVQRQSGGVKPVSYDGDFLYAISRDGAGH